MKVCNPFSISGFRYRLVTGTSQTRAIMHNIDPLYTGLDQTWAMELDTVQY